MSDDFDNPYASPSVLPDTDVLPEPTGDQLAGRFTRLSAVMVDGILLLAILMPVQILTGYREGVTIQQAGWLEQIAMSLLGIMVMLMLNGYLLFTRGQTIGKMLTGIQIVDFTSGRLLPFWRVYVFRYLWMLPLVLIVALIPGTVDDLLINIVFLIDALMIFGANRRCLHDLIAGSKVVLYKTNRQPLVY